MYRRTSQEEGNRLVEIYSNGEWSEKRSFADIKIGNRFRLYEPDGTLVKNDEGVYEFRATSDVYSHPEYHVLTVDVIPIMKEQFKEA